MINLSKEDFLKKKEENKAFSIINEFRGDEFTPITIFNSINGCKKFIFESEGKGGVESRYSYISEEPYLEILGNDIVYDSIAENEYQEIENKVRILKEAILKW